MARYYRRATYQFIAHVIDEPWALIDTQRDIAQTSVLYFFFSFIRRLFRIRCLVFRNFQRARMGQFARAISRVFEAGGMAESTHSERYARNALSGCTRAVICPLSSHFYRTGVNRRKQLVYETTGPMHESPRDIPKERYSWTNYKVIYKIDQMLQISMPVVINVFP